MKYKSSVGFRGEEKLSYEWQGFCSVNLWLSGKKARNRAIRGHFVEFITAGISIRISAELELNLTIFSPKLTRKTFFIISLANISRKSRIKFTFS